MIKITKATGKEAAVAATLALRLWEDNTLEGLTAEFGELLASEEAAVYLLYADESNALFFTPKNDITVTLNVA